MASEVGSGQVAVFPTFKGFRRNTLKEIEAAEKAGSRTFRQGFSRSSAATGTAAGKSFRTAFASSTSGVTATLTKEYASASKALSTARLSELDAIGKVRVAETSLTEARSKALPGSARVVAAEERLATSQRRLVAAQDVTKRSTEGLAAAKAALSTRTDGANRSFGSFFSSLRGSRGFQAVTNGASNLARTLGGAVVSAVGFVVRSFLTLSAVGVAAVTGIAAAIGTMVIRGGISRALNIEDAQAKLRGLGHTADSVAAIMTDALAAVKGTAFGLDEAATVAASAVAAGIRPGQQLEKYLRLTADAATIAGVSLGEMGSIINKTTTSGKVFTDNLNQLADRGIPIFKWLQDEYAVTADELSDMVSQGKVDAETFRRVIEKNIGGAALSAGNTTRGAFANMRAAMSRAGAALVSDALPRFKDFFTRVGEFFDSMKDTSTAWGAAIGNAANGFLTVLERVMTTISNVAKADGGFSLENLRREFGSAFPELEGVFRVIDELGPSLPGIVDGFADIGRSVAKILPDLTKLATDVLPVIASALELIGPALKGIADAMDDLSPKLVNGARQWEDILSGGTETADEVKRDLESTGLDWEVWFNWPSLMASFGNGWAQITGAFANGWTQIQHGTMDFIVGLVGSFANGWNQIQQGVGGFLGGLLGSLANGWNQIVSGVQGAISSIVASFANGWNQIVQGGQGVLSFLGGIPGTIIGFFAGAGSWLFSAGQNIINGLVNGIKSAVANIASAAAGAVNTAIEAAKSAAGIKSPSRVFRDEIGKQLGAGMVLGIKDSRASVADATSSLMDFSRSTAVGQIVARGGTVSSPATSPTVVISSPVYADTGALIGMIETVSDGRIALRFNLENRVLQAGRSREFA